MEDPHAPSSSGQHNKHRPLSFSAPSHRPHRYYREPWSATLLDQAKLFASHLLCVAGSGALAKTAVAPLERIKVRRSPRSIRATAQAHSKLFAVLQWVLSGSTRLQGSHVCALRIPACSFCFKSSPSPTCQ